MKKELPKDLNKIRILLKADPSSTDTDIIEYKPISDKEFEEIIVTLKNTKVKKEKVLETIENLVEHYQLKISEDKQRLRDGNVKSFNILFYFIGSLALIAQLSNAPSDFITSIVTFVVIAIFLLGAHFWVHKPYKNLKDSIDKDIRLKYKRINKLRNIMLEEETKDSNFR